MVIERYSALQMAIISLLNLPNLGPLIFLTTSKPSSQHNPTFCLRSRTDNVSSIYKPTSSDISVPSKLPLSHQTLGYQNVLSIYHWNRIRKTFWNV